MVLDFFRPLMHHGYFHYKTSIIVKPISLSHLITLIFCTLFNLVASAADIEREKHLAEQIKDSLIVGEIANLQANGEEFIALINNQEPAKPRGSIIILHGMSAHPNSPQIIYPLRSQLASLGWVTAAIQLPVLAADATIDDYLKQIKPSAGRIQSSLDYMRHQFKNRPCVLVAHSLGAIMAVNFMAQQQKLACDALVLIGLPTIASELPEAQSLELLKKISIPTLDIYGSQDLNSVKEMAPTRQLTLLKGSPLNRQVEIAGADHTFNGLNDTLIRSVHSWLVHIFNPTQ